MSFTTPTVDVYVPGTTLGIGNVNAGTINIGKAGTTVNVGGTMAVTNSVTTPSCTMSSMNVSSLIIAPFSGDVAFNNFSARNATIGNASIINASFNSINSSNILIGPYPVSGTFISMNVSNASIGNASISNLSSTNINVLNASMTYVNVSGLLINPLPTNPVFSGINTGSDTTTLSIGNNTNSIALNGAVTLAKPLILGSIPTTSLSVLGGSIKYSFNTTTNIAALGSATFGSFTNVPIGIYLFTLGPFTIFNLDPTDRIDIVYSMATNITFISSSTNMEMAGNTVTKFGICFTIPISVNSNTNQLTIIGTSVSGDFSYTGGASSLLRIA
jgi:hypothetical protein